MVTTSSTTSMGAAIGGWLAAIGLLALALPFVQTYAVALAPTVPILSAYLVAIAAAYLVGGYMAGRAAGSRTGWHGLLTGILTLAVVLALTLFSTTLNPVATWMAAAFPSDAVRIWVPDYGTYPPGVIAAVVIVLTAWLGGLLAPTRVLTAVRETTAVAPTERRVVERTERTTYRRAPQVGAKGGEPHEDESKRPPTT